MTLQLFPSSQHRTDQRPQQPPRPQRNDPDVRSKRERLQAVRQRYAIEGMLYTGFLLLGHLTTAYSRFVNLYAVLLFLLALVIVTSPTLTAALQRLVRERRSSGFLAHICIPVWAPTAVYLIGAVIG